MSALLSGEQYKEYLNTKKMSELKNMITTVVKHVRFTLSGKKKEELINHLMEHTRLDTKSNSVILMGKLDTVMLPEGQVRDTSKTASGATRKVRADKGIKKIKESKTIEKIVVPMSSKKAEKLASDKAKLDMMVKQEASKPMPVLKNKMLPTVAETGYVKKVLPPGLKLRKKRSDAGEPRKKKEKTIQ
jgi:hypothetical protein